MATLHAWLEEGVDSQAAIRDIKKELASKHDIDHATVEPEFGARADDEHRH